MVGSSVRNPFAAVILTALLSPAIPAAAEDALISGQIMYYGTAEAVPNASVVVGGNEPMIIETGADGVYDASQASQSAVTVEPVKNGDYAGAISPFDASRVLQAVVGLNELDELHTIACDVTGDGTVSALDAAHILRFSIGSLDRFAAADACDSDWVFVPAAEPAANQQTQTPDLEGDSCVRGGIRYDPLDGNATGQNFIAILIGDCSGNWNGEEIEDPATPTAEPTATPTFTVLPTNTAVPTSTFTLPPTATFTIPPSQTPTAVPTATSTSAPSQTPVPSATFTASPSQTSTAVPSATLTQTPTRTPTSTPSRTSTPTATPSRTGTPTRTHTPTRTSTSTVTPTRTPSNTRTQTSTRTPTITLTPTLTRTSTATRTHTPTQTPTVTRTPTFTATSSPTPTQSCPNGSSWQISQGIPISTQLGGSLWLADTVTTDNGWGLFWLRDDPGFSNVARLYYAHVDVSGDVTHGPMLIASIPKITWRQRYYMAAWHEDHFAVITAEYASLYYHTVTKSGAVSGRHIVGPTLLYSSVWDSEADGNIDGYPGGFVAVVEGECSGHSCSYGFKLDPSGDETAFVNLVDFDLTHQFYPRVASDGSGFALLSVKDIQINTGGVMTKYWQANGQMKPHVKVVPTKQYNWDEFPDLAFNGDHFAAIWTENAIRQHGANWQIRFATFDRDSSGGNVISDRVLHGPGEKSLHRWTTRVHASGNDWLVHYARRTASGANQAVFEILDSAATTRASMTPFTLTADALGSSPHTLPGMERTVGVVRGDNGVAESQVTFYFVDAPTCQ